MGNMGDVEAQRFTRLNSRKQFCKEVNEMFGLDIDVDFPKRHVHQDGQGRCGTRRRNGERVG